MLFIGGTEGSGTRLLSIFCEKAKMDRGSNLNKSRDSISMATFYKKWTRNYLEDNYDDADIRSRFISCVDKHIGDNSYSNCYIKEPRNLMFLPLIHSIYPDAKFIHIVRSGLSMAFSSNRRHTRHYGDLFVDSAKGWTPEIAEKVWNDTNLAAFEYGTKHMGDNYLLVRFEDICKKKMDVYKSIAGVIGCSEDVIPSVMRKVDIPESWKRGRNHTKEVISKIEEIGKKAIDTFGYTCIHFK